MDASGAMAEHPEEELSSSRSSSSCKSENCETSEDEVRRTKSKKKLLPDGFLDPLPPRKTSKLSMFPAEMAQRGPGSQGMVIKDILPPAPAGSSVSDLLKNYSATHPNEMHRIHDRHKARQRRKPNAPLVDDVGPTPTEAYHSIAKLRGSHRAAHLDLATVLEPMSHLLMIREWPIICPRMIEMLKNIGLDSVRHLQYIKLDHHLLTAFVERWSHQTNTFHLPVGEMTITLQDVGIILGVCVDGMPLVGSNVVGIGRRWVTWPECCDELLGNHPKVGLIYHHPEHAEITSTFRMGQASKNTCLPLRWLRWIYYRVSYTDLDEVIFLHHVRAYVLFMLGCFLIPDTSGNEVHLRYLPLMEDLTNFARYSLGGAILAHLYRELKEATKPSRVYMAGCMHLLQIWIWERLFIGRPTLHAPIPRDLEGKSLGFRWNENYLREMRPSVLAIYRDQIDGLLESQVLWEPYNFEIMLKVSEICKSGVAIWRSRVPLICWRIVEWHLPDRVMRQFGVIQRIDIEPMESNFKRVDGRGRGNVDWLTYHKSYIQLWDQRHDLVVEHDDSNQDRDKCLRRYLHWYRSWAILYLLKASIKLPSTYYPRAPGERILRHFQLQTEEILKPFFGMDEDSPRQNAINKVEELCISVHKSMHIVDDRCEVGPSSQNTPYSASQPHGGVSFGFASSAPD